MPGVVFHVDLFTFSFFFLGMRISLPLFHSALSLPFILWCSVYQLPPPPPPTWNEISRRMVTKSNCFIWMMHPGIYVLFLDVIVIVFLFFLLCCSSKLFFFFTSTSRSLSFLCVDWLCLFTSQLHPLHNPSHLCPLYMFDVGVLRSFWMVSMLHPTLADWLWFSFFLGLLITLWLCEAPIFGCV